MLFQERVLLFSYLDRQPVRPIFPVLPRFLLHFSSLGGVSYFPKFPKLLISFPASLGKIRFRGVGMGWKLNIGGGVLFNVFYANLKFREILVQLYAMHAKYYLILVGWVILIYYMCWGRVC